MRKRVESSNMADYLQCTEIIDFDNLEISSLANELSKDISSEIELAKKIYEYVRDKIAHSADISGTIVTCKASEVMKTGEGICYAKSHLLAALLRKNGIPTGFCYQLLRLDNEIETSPLILHGLNAVYLRKLNRWIRIDARGNKETVYAQFNISSEQLAFRVHTDLGEVDFPYIFINPDYNAVQALKQSASIPELWENLPTSLFRII